MTHNEEERLIEACEHHWLGEVSVLEESLVHLRRRRMRRGSSASTAHLRRRERPSQGTPRK
jgi:hypothetical protein